MAAIHEQYFDEAQYVVHHGDWRELLDVIPSDSVDLTITSPPYCIGKSYDESTTVDAFRKEHTDIIRVRLLCDDFYVHNGT